MAKKKAKRRRSSSRSVSRRSSGNRAFAGDIILGIWQVFGGCCSTAAVALLGAIVYGLAPDIKKEMYKKVSDPSVRHTIDTMTQPTGIALIVLAVAYFIFTFFFAIATCQGRKWAIWLHFLLSLPSAVFVVLYGTEGIRFGSGLPIIVAVYCLLRILGAVGPKL